MQQKRNSQGGNKKNRDDIVHLGRGRKPYRVERGEHGEFKKVKGPAK